jgi:hypothetical protein
MGFVLRHFFLYFQINLFRLRLGAAQLFASVGQDFPEGLVEELIQNQNQNQKIYQLDYKG